MFIAAPQLAHAKILDPQGNLLCHLKRVIIDPANGQILAFLTTYKGRSGSSRANLISPHDILHWKREALILGNRYEFHPLSDLVRVQHLFKTGPTNLIGLKVRTENGQKLGIVTDYTINISMKVLASITAQKTLFHFLHFDTRLIHQKNIIEITPKEIIVKDTTIKSPALNLAQSTPDKFSLQNSPTFDRA